MWRAVKLSTVSVIGSFAPGMTSEMPMMKSANSSVLVPMMTEIFSPLGDLLTCPALIACSGTAGSPPGEPSTTAVNPAIGAKGGTGVGHSERDSGEVGAVLLHQGSLVEWNPQNQSEYGSSTSLSDSARMHASRSVPLHAINAGQVNISPSGKKISVIMGTNTDD